MTNAITTCLKFAELQMAAESLFGATPLTAPGMTFGAGSMSVATLTRGNNRASKFTGAEAAQFFQDWEVVEHKANTTTGFSGTLFRYTGPSEPSRGLVSGELVRCFRSTEFIDDAARDNQATNSLEIKEKGWAFGQIADMENWVKDLGLKYGDPLTVTGYSLGGHLATAFNLLHPGLANATYTFNGAGVGKEKNGAPLADTIANFDKMRQTTADLGDQFTNPAVRAVYESLRSSLVNGAIPTEAQRQAVLALLPAPGSLPGPLMSTDPDVQLLYEAFTRIQTIQAELLRIGNPPNVGTGADIIHAGAGDDTLWGDYTAHASTPQETHIELGATWAVKLELDPGRHGRDFIDINALRCTRTCTARTQQSRNAASLGGQHHA